MPAWMLRSISKRKSKCSRTLTGDFYKLEGYVVPKPIAIPPPGARARANPAANALE